MRHLSKKVKDNATTRKQLKTDGTGTPVKPISPIEQLHHAIGNRAVQRMFKSGVIRAKLTVGQPNDKYEDEADQVADQVMRMPESKVQRQPHEEEETLQAKPNKASLLQRQPNEEEEELQTKSINGLIQRQTEVEEEEEEETLQAKEEPGQSPKVSNEVESTINTLRGGGQPLSPSDRNFFEPRFDQDFSQVRIHTDAKAADTAKAVNARAYTLGQDVVFGAGEFSSGSSSGRKLLAHELTHVLQQTRSSSYQGNNDGGIDTAGEAEAHAVEHAVSSGQLAKTALKSLKGEKGENRTALRKGGLPALQDRPRQPNSEDLHFNWFQEHWRGRANLEDKIHELVQHMVAIDASRRTQLFFYARALGMPSSLTPERGDARREIIRNAAERFIAWAEPQVINELAADPSVTAVAWQNELVRWGSQLNDGRLANFRRRVNDLVMEMYSQQAETEAMSRTRIPARRIRRLVDLKMRNIVKDLKQDFDIATVSGVNAWHMPRVPPESESAVWGGAADIIGAAGAAVAVFFPPVTLVAGIVAVGFAVASGVSGGMAYYTGNREQDEAFRMQVLEDSIKESTRVGFELVSDSIEAKLDVFAMILTIEALNAGVNIERIGADDLENFLWPKMFGPDFPQGRSRGRRHVMQTMSEVLDQRLPDR